MISNLFERRKNYEDQGATASRRLGALTQIPSDDGTHILYVNSLYQDNSDLGRLMHDFNCSNPDDMHYGILADKTRYLKESEKGVSEMCKAMEDIRNESYAEGKAETIKIFLNNAHDAALVATYLNEPIDYIEKIAKDNNIALK